jgi:hypothetical protein
MFARKGFEMERIAKEEHKERELRVPVVALE